MFCFLSLKAEVQTNVKLRIFTLASETLGEESKDILHCSDRNLMLLLKQSCILPW